MPRNGDPPRRGVAVVVVTDGMKRELWTVEALDVDGVVGVVGPVASQVDGHNLFHVRRCLLVPLFAGSGGAVTDAVAGIIRVGVGVG